jgi:gas vesicle protein
MSQKDNFGAGFVLGSIVGGIVGGIVGVAVTRQNRDRTIDESRGDRLRRRSRSLDAASHTPDEIERTRRNLEDKIADLHGAIDDVRRSAFAQQPIEEDAESFPSIDLPRE